MKITKITKKIMGSQLYILKLLNEFGEMSYPELLTKIQTNKKNIIEKLGLSGDVKNLYPIIEKMKNAKYIKSTREKQIPSKAILSILKDGYEILEIFGFPSK